MAKVAVVGSRTFNDYDLLKDELESLERIDVIVSGGAKGADSLAQQYADEKNIETKIHLPEWEKYGRAAGPKRNQKIIRESDVVVAFWDGKSRGTLSSIKIAEKMGKAIRVVTFNP